MTNRNTMTTGHVFKLSDGFYGIFTFTKPYTLCTFLVSDTVDNACLELGDTFAGNFRPASDTVAKFARKLMGKTDTLVLSRVAGCELYN